MRGRETLAKACSAVRLGDGAYSSIDYLAVSIPLDRQHSCPLLTALEHHDKEIAINVALKYHPACVEVFAPKAARIAYVKAGEPFVYRVNERGYF